MFNWKPYQAKAVAFRFYYGDVYCKTELRTAIALRAKP
jgi:hypothetical protein